MTTETNISYDPNGLGKGCPDFDVDSGMDDCSEISSPCEKKSAVFSSAESFGLPSKPAFLPNEFCVKSKCQDFIEYEKNSIKIVYDMPAELRLRPKPSETVSELLSRPSGCAFKAEPIHVDQKSLDEDDDIALDKLPQFMQDLFAGRHISVDFEIPLDKKPPWYSEEKYKRGQAFAQKYFFCINYAETVSLFLVFALTRGLQALIFTGKSDTPFKACQRYLSTLTRLMTWYKNDPWEDNSAARQNLVTVRGMHRNVQQNLEQSSPEELFHKSSILNRKEPIWSPGRVYLVDDFRGACPVPPPGACPFRALRQPALWINQFDMAVTQFSFVGLVVTFPTKFGIHFASDEDLEGFIHMWQTLGYLLGIHDKYNFCNVGLEGVRQRTQDFINLMFKPSLRHVSGDWEHMCRCLVQGIAFYVPGFNFDTSLKYLCGILNIHTPRLSKSLSLWQSFMVYVVDFTFNVICKIPGAVKFYNGSMLRTVRRAQRASPQLLSKWEKTQFPYMKETETSIKAV